MAVPAQRLDGGQPAGRAWWVASALAAVSVGVYAGLVRADFVSFDDPRYVTQNPHVLGGLTAANLRWALTTGHDANWLPLTWLSHQVDQELYGAWAGGHHLTSIVLHAASVVVLFAALGRMTGRLWPSAAVAALFALHPLNVESVAWIAQRKAVLSGLFATLTLWSYARYTERETLRRYLLVALCLALGLMAKPTLVPLPLVLLLLDYWPFERSRTRTIAWLVLEKGPLLLLSGLSSLVTLRVQEAGGAVSALDLVPLRARAANAAVSYARYVGKLLWPRGLAVLYPHPNTAGGTPWEPWQVLAATAFLAAATLLALAARRRRYLAVGWLWYLVMLLPVIGLVQAGAQAMADRYAYLALIGPFVIVAWSGAEVASGSPARRRAVTALALLALAALAAGTSAQARHWTDSRSLYEHTLAVTRDNWTIHNNLGNVHLRAGRAAEAVAEYRRAVAIGPSDPKPYNNLAWVLATSPDPRLRDGAEAVRLAETAVRNAGDADPGTLDTLAAAYAEAGRFDRATEVAERAALLAARAGDEGLAASVAERAALYRRGRPFRAVGDPEGRPAAAH